MGVGRHTLDQQEGKGSFCGGGRGARARFTAGPSCLALCGLLSRRHSSLQFPRHSTKGVVLGAPGPIFPHSLDRDEPRSSIQPTAEPAPNRGGGVRTPSALCLGLSPQGGPLPSAPGHGGDVTTERCKVL